MLAMEANMQAIRSENLTMTGELEIVSKRLKTAQQDIDRLDKIERENAKTLGERVFDIVKLSQ
jgi:RPA family protein